MSGTSCVKSTDHCCPDHDDTSRRVALALVAGIYRARFDRRDGAVRKHPLLLVHSDKVLDNATGRIYRAIREILKFSLLEAKSTIRLKQEVENGIQDTDRKMVTDIVRKQSGIEGDLWIDWNESKIVGDEIIIQWLGPYKKREISKFYMPAEPGAATKDKPRTKTEAKALLRKEIEDWLKESYGKGLDNAKLQERFAPYKVNWDMINEDAQRFLEDYSIKLSDHLSAQAEFELRSTIADGLRQGKGAKDIERMIRDQVEDTYEGRAETIARTEGMRALNQGRLKAYDEMGFDEVFWIASDLACPKCSALDNRIFKLGEEPPIPFHVNCRCLVSPKAEVLTASGWKMISKINDADLVLTHNGRYRHAKLLTFPTKRERVYRLRMKDIRSPYMTAEHPILTSRGWKPISEVKNGEPVLVFHEYIFKWENAKIKTRITKHDPKKKFYNLKVDEDESYIVTGGFVTHNCTTGAVTKFTPREGEKVDYDFETAPEGFEW